MSKVIIPNPGKFPVPTALPPPEILRAITQMCLDVRVPLAFGLAMAFHESEFNPDAVAKDPRDLARGGSFGLFQMSLQTAHELVPGVAFSGKDLCDIHLNCELTGDLMHENRVRLKRVHPSQRAASVFLDLAAMHNSGKIFAQAPLETRYKYVPAIVVATEAFRKLLEAA